MGVQRTALLENGRYVFTLESTNNTQSQAFVKIVSTNQTANSDAKYFKRNLLRIDDLYRVEFN